MKMSTKMIVGISLMGALVMACAAAGYFGVKALSQSLAYVTGPAWSTADGIMEASIELETQMLAAEDVFQDRHVEESLRTVEETQSNVSEALHGAIASGLLSNQQIQEFKKLRTKYDSSLDRLLNDHAEFVVLRDEFNEHSAKFIALGEELEEIGDGAVEEIEENPDQQITWNNGLREKWEAADGGMESSIGMLTAMYAIQRLQHGDDPQDIRVEMDKAIAFHEEAMTGMLATGRFDTPYRDTGETLAAVYSTMFTEYKHLLNEMFDHTVAMHNDHDTYQLAARTLLTDMVELEKAGDHAIDGEMDKVASTISSARTGIFVSLGASIVIGLAIGYLMLGSLKGFINQINEVLSKVAKGNMTVRMDDNRNDELGDVARMINAFTSSLEHALCQVQSESHQINNNSQQIAMTSQNIAESASTQAANLQEISASLEEISSVIQTSAEHATKASSLSEQSQTSAAKGRDEMTQMTGAMDEIAKSSSDISNIIKVIDDIAFQTNLLALNAAVEAARAGEAGKGFAVVAEEVRNLAQRSAEAAKNTSAMIEDSSARVENGVAIASKVGDALDSIISGTSQVDALLLEITKASTQQADGISQINKAVVDLDETTQKNAGNSEELASSAEETAANVIELRKLVDAFNVVCTVDYSGKPSGKSHNMTSAKKPTPKAKISSAKKAAVQTAAATIPMDDDDLGTF